MRNTLKSTVSSYVVNAVDERVVTAVTHRQPVTAQPDYVDIFVSEVINAF